MMAELQIVRPGLLYAAIFSWLSITGGRFLAPYLETEVGMSDTSIGACLAMQSAIVTVGGSLVGPWADQRESQLPGRGRSEIVAMGVLWGTVCSLLHGLIHVSPILFASPLFHFVLRIGYACSNCCIHSVTDAITLQYLQNHPTKSREDYGRERLFGAITWAIVHFIYGIMIDWYGFSVTYPLAILVGGLVLLSIFVYAKAQSNQYKALSKQRSDIRNDIGDSDENTANVEGQAANVLSGKEEEQEVGARARVITILKLFFGTYSAAAFMVCLFLLSSGQAVVDQLVFLFFETLESSYTMMACTVVLTVAFEIPIFQVAPLLLEKTDSGILLLIACLSYIFRVLGYASIPKGHIAWVLLLEPMHGVTYACAQTSSVDTAARCSPKGWEATGQSLISLITGAGSFLGLLYGGWAVQHLGGRRMFQISSFLVSIGAVGFACTKFCGTRREGVITTSSSGGFGAERYFVLQKQESPGEDGHKSTEINIQSGLELPPLERCNLVESDISA